MRAQFIGFGIVGNIVGLEICREGRGKPVANRSYALKAADLAFADLGGFLHLPFFGYDRYVEQAEC